MSFGLEKFYEKIKKFKVFSPFRVLFYFVRVQCKNTIFLMGIHRWKGILSIQGGMIVTLAKLMKDYCWLNQQVTIGHLDHDRPPIIGNNVMIICEVKVLGSISIGDNAIIGANACVIKDVESGAVMCGVPARKIK